MGDDGHTASLFPGSPIDNAGIEAAIPVTADYDGRPANRVTLTPPVFNSARNILFLVSGASKTEAAAAVLEGPRDLRRWPVQRIRPKNGAMYWMMDEDAAGNLSAALLD
jgi:6-phosphogluconolactonase